MIRSAGNREKERVLSAKRLVLYDGVYVILKETEEADNYEVAGTETTGLRKKGFKRNSLTSSR